MPTEDWIKQVRGALSGASDDEKEAFEFLVFDLRRLRAFREMLLKTIEGGYPPKEVAESVAK